METNPFKVDFDIATGMVVIRDNIPDGCVRFSSLLDEARPLADQWLAAIRKAETILCSPLMNARLIDEVVEMAKGIATGKDVHPAHVMVDYYKSSLQLFSDIAVAVHQSNRGDPSALRTCLEIVEVMLEKHKRHLPESGLHPQSHKP